MIEIGEYARMKSGEILKITGTCYEIDDYKIYKTDRNYTIVEDEIKSHSKNIVDLIEVGDIVHTMEVLDEEPYTWDEDIYYIWSENHLSSIIKAIKNRINLIEILTHEQYEQNCYRLEK